MTLIHVVNVRFSGDSVLTPCMRLTFHVPSAPSYLDRILDALARGLRDEHPARWKNVLSGGNITRFAWKAITSTQSVYGF